MPRKRTPSPEQQAQHRSVARACATIVHSIALVNPGDLNLHMAQRCLDEFADSKIEQAKPRTRNTKPAPQRELAHLIDHSV